MSIRRMYYTMTSGDGKGVHVHHSEYHGDRYMNSTDKRVNPAMSGLSSYYDLRTNVQPNLTGIRKMVKVGRVDHLLVHIMKKDASGGSSDGVMEDRIERVDIGKDLDAALERASRLVGVPDAASPLASTQTLIPLDSKGKLVPDAKLESPGVHWMFSPRFSGEVTFVEATAEGSVFMNEAGVKLWMTLEELSQAVPQMVNGVLSGSFTYVRVGAGFGIEFSSTMKVEKETKETKETTAKGGGKLREWDQ